MMLISNRRLATLGTLLGLMVALAGCQQSSPAHSGDDGHDHGAEMLTVTGWSNAHEAFAEFPHLLAGVPATMYLHLTELASAGPVVDGAVTLFWSDSAGGTFLRTVPAPTKPGLYQAEISLPTAGHWTLEITPAGYDEAVVLPDIHVAASSLDALHDHGAHEVEGDGEVTMTKDQQWRLGVSSTPVRRETYTQPVRVAATVEAPPERRVAVTTPVAGRVSVFADRALPTLGTTVRAGDVLLAMRVPLTGDAGALAGAESDLVRANQDLQLAERELIRAQTLLAAGAASTRRVEEAEAAVAAARATQHAASRLLDGRGDEPARQIIAPIDGVVVALHVSPGQYVEAGTPVVTILDPTQVWVRGHIPETALGDLPSAPRARLGIHGDVNTTCDIEGAALIYLAPEIDPASRTAAVIYAVDNHDLHLRPGQSLGLALDTHTTTDGLVVPTSALVDEHGRPVVFIQTAGETFVKRHVTLDGHDGHRALVATGLAEGERVVIEAAWAVKLAGADTAAPGHGHTH